MSTLILTLPLASTGAPEYDYVLSPDGQQISLQGRTVAAMLPAPSGRGSDVVAVLPARALSWHRIALPLRVLRGMLSGRTEAVRARGVLTGVLEERLLDDAEQLHFAVFDAEATDAAGASLAWVAVCNRAWLHSALQTLEAAGHTVGRIVAECQPTADGACRVLLSNELQPAQMLLCTAEGVSLLPLLPASLALAKARSPSEVSAEPSVMALAEQHFGSQTSLQTRGQRLVQAAQSPWNLAQLELSASPGGRLRKRLASAWNTVLHSPPWRPARWALLALMVVHITGLNALAWHQRNLQAEQRAAITAVLRQTFPEVPLVVDAPLQMQRAVDDLARARGVGSDADLGRVFSIISPLAPPGMALSNIALSGNRLQLQVTGVDSVAATKLSDALALRGLRAQWQEGQFTIEPRERK